MKYNKAIPATLVVPKGMFLEYFDSFLIIL